MALTRLSAIVVVVLLSLWAVRISAQPVAGTACPSHSGYVNSVSFPCTIASGSNRAVIVIVTREVAVTVSNLSFAGSALTSVGSVTGALSVHAMAMYRQLNPPTGSQNLVYDLSPAGYTSGNTAPFTNVHQTTPVDTAATNTGPAASGTTVTVTSATGDLVVDSVYQAFGDCAATPIAPGATQTLLFADQTNGTAAGMSTKAGAASVPMTWTCAIPDEWLAIGVSLNPVAAAAAPSAFRRRF
jgi:hypothetical protein